MGDLRKFLRSALMATNTRVNQMADKFESLLPGAGSVIARRNVGSRPKQMGAEKSFKTSSSQAVDSPATPSGRRNYDRKENSTELLQGASGLVELHLSKAALYSSE